MREAEADHIISTLLGLYQHLIDPIQLIDQRSYIMAISPSQSVILIVDPFSTGCMVAQEIKERGYPIMAVWVRNLDFS